MVETDPEQDGPNKRAPNWVDIGTLVVLTLTMIVVAVYTILTYEQMKLTALAIESDSRPLLSAGFNGGTKPEAGKPLTFQMLVINTGRLQTRAIVRTGIQFSLTPLEAPSIDREKPGGIFRPLGIQMPHGVVIESKEVLSEGQLSDMRSGKGLVYVAVEILYEGGKYDTAICSAFAPIKDPKGELLLDMVGNCDRPDSNRAN